MKIRRHYVFRGAVQGVGFRYRAQYAAQLYGVTGWVKNNWDGTVEMEAQGTEEQIRKVIAAVERGTFVAIDASPHYDMPIDEEEYGFHVR